ncbi:MAG: hypothetical protein IJI51_08695, partial [Lachnospiraceae bacterium]|nr:hypothetical protein [Lachnospiraceae bacterium]
DKYMKDKQNKEKYDFAINILGDIMSELEEYAAEYNHIGENGIRDPKWYAIQKPMGVVNDKIKMLSKGATES